LSKPESKRLAVLALAGHWRLGAGIAAGICGGLLAQALEAPESAHLLVGWDVGAATYLALMWRLFLTADAEAMRSRAAQEDESRSMLLLIVLLAILASLIGVIDAMLAVRTSTGPERAIIASCAGVTLVLSWLVLQTVFVPHYAHRHFGEGSGAGGIAFPGEPPSSYMDFVYLAFSVGATFQVSDNSILTSRLRRLVTAHAAAAFVYNTAILALGINIIAGVIGS
jgi:uncharacterized membrane protein